MRRGVAHRLEHRGGGKAGDGADVTQLRKVEIQTAGEGLHHRPKLLVGPGQVAQEDVLGAIQQILECRERLRRREIGKHLREIRARPFRFGVVSARGA